MIIQKRSVLLYPSYYSLEKISKTNAVLTIIASFNLIAKDGIRQKWHSPKMEFTTAL